MKNELIKKAHVQTEYTNEQIMELYKCTHDPIYFMKTYMKVMHPVKGSIPFAMFPYQEELVKSFIANRWTMTMLSRQMGKTTVIAAYLLWFTCFKFEKYVLVASKDNDAAIDVMDRIRYSYEELPMWLKPGCIYFNRHEISFDNNSSVKSSATTENTGRGRSISCVHGDTSITIRYKNSTELPFKIAIGIFYQNLSTLNHHKTSFQDNRYCEILTSEGFKSFAGILKSKSSKNLKLSTSQGELICTSTHKLQMDNGKFKYASDLVPDDLIITDTKVLAKVVNLIVLDEQMDVYDAINVGTKHTYLTNGLSSHNCLMLDELAFVNPQIQSAMWASLAPTLSTGGQCIISSTPNGDQELFAQLWRGAITNGLGKAGDNGFVPMFAPWDAHPERDEAYERMMIQKVGELKWKQEYVCEFLSSEPLLINSLVLNRLKGSAPIFEDGGFKWWYQISPKKTYLIGVDVSEGLSQDYSVIQIFEASTLTQVAEFRESTYSESQLYDKLKWVFEYILKKKDAQGTKPTILWSFENNACGKVISTLFYNDAKFPEEAELISVGNKLGMNTSAATKAEASLLLKRLVEGDNTMHLCSESLITELKAYVQNGKSGTYAAQAGATDDLISACLIIARLVKHAASFDDETFDRLYRGKGSAVKLDQQEVFTYDDARAEDEPMPYIF